MNWTALSAYFSPTVSGHPSWYARYLQQGLCRIKWLSAAGVFLWIAQAAAIYSYGVEEYFTAAAESLRIGAQALINGSVAVGIFGALVMLLVGRERISVLPARMLVVFGALTALASEALLVGFAHLSFTRVASLDLVLLIVLAIAPLGFATLIGITAAILAITLGTAWASGLSPQRAHVLFLVHPLSFAVLGIVVNRWYVGVFKSARIAELRLLRHAQLLERQKQLIEWQRNEAESQRGEIATQRGRLQHALASALTTPVAQAFEHERRFPTTLKTVCVIACDAVGFSETCRKLQPERVVSELEKFFRKFDAACLKYHVEPLRAQGDERIAIAGLWPEADRGLHHTTISAILAMLDFKRWLPPLDGKGIPPQPDLVLWPARIGICLGPASCGVIDTGDPRDAAITGRLWFDVWGDTVNLAARLEQAAQPNQILVREGVLWETCGLFDYGPIRQMQVKSTILSDATEILGIRKPYRDEDGQPNQAFWDVCNSPQRRPYRPNLAGSLAGEDNVIPFGTGHAG